LIFYNLDALQGEEEGVIVEGEMDTLTLVECGIYNVVGVPNGTAPKNSKMNLEYLNNCWEAFTKLKRVIIAVDNDEVGKFLKEELGRRIGKEKCKVVTYPEGCKDPNEILLKYGREAVQDFINGARDWPIEGLVPMDDQFDELVTYYEDGYPPGLKSRMDGMDDLLTFFPGHLTMVTGIPGHGKDELTNELMMSLSKYEDMRWGVFNFEEPPTIHTTKLIEKYCKKAFAYRKDPAHRLSKMEFEQAVVFIDQHFYQVNVGAFDVTIIAGLIGVMVAELVGETREKIQGGPKTGPNRPEGLYEFRRRPTEKQQEAGVSPKLPAPGEKELGNDDE